MKVAPGVIVGVVGALIAGFLTVLPARADTTEELPQPREISLMVQLSSVSTPAALNQLVDRIEHIRAVHRDPARPGYVRNLVLLDIGDRRDGKLILFKTPLDVSSATSQVNLGRPSTTSSSALWVSPRAQKSKTSPSNSAMWSIPGGAHISKGFLTHAQPHSTSKIPSRWLGSSWISTTSLRIGTCPGRRSSRLCSKTSPTHRRGMSSARKRRMI